MSYFPTKWTPDARRLILDPVSKKAPKALIIELPPDARVGIVAARFNAEFVDQLLEGCRNRLREMGVDESRIEVHAVPGAFELPLSAKLLAETRRFAAIICLGCVIRGQTAHFEFVAGECARGIQQVMLQTNTPVIFGVLTTENEAQARDRLGGKHGHAGIRAAAAAADMIAFVRSIRS